MSELLSSKSEINTNMEMVELKGNVVNQLEAMSVTERDFTISSVEKFIINSGRPGHMMLLSNELRYYTILKLTSADIRQAAEEIVKFIEEDEFFAQHGSLKLIEESGNGHLEVWVGNKFFALFNCDGFFVEV